MYDKLNSCILLEKAKKLFYVAFLSSLTVEEPSFSWKKTNVLFSLQPETRL